MTVLAFNIKSDGTGDYVTLAACLADITTKLNSGVWTPTSSFTINLVNQYASVVGRTYLTDALHTGGLYIEAPTAMAITAAGLSVDISITSPAGKYAAILLSGSSLLSVTGLDAHAGRIDVSFSNVLFAGSRATVFTGYLSACQFNTCLTDGTYSTLAIVGDSQCTCTKVKVNGGSPFDIIVQGDPTIDAFQAGAHSVYTYGLVIDTSRLGSIRSNKPAKITNMLATGCGLTSYEELAGATYVNPRTAFTNHLGSLLDQVMFPAGTDGQPRLILREGGLYRRLVIDHTIEGGAASHNAIAIYSTAYRRIVIQRCLIKHAYRAIFAVGNYHGEVTIKENVFSDVRQGILNKSLAALVTDPTQEFRDQMLLINNRISFTDAVDQTSDRYLYRRENWNGSIYQDVICNAGPLEVTT